MLKYKKCKDNVGAPNHPAGSMTIQHNPESSFVQQTSQTRKPHSSSDKRIPTRCPTTRLQPSPQASYTISRLASPPHTGVSTMKQCITSGIEVFPLSGSRL